MYTVTEIENAIIQKLKEQLRDVRLIGSLGDFLIDEQEKNEGPQTKIYVVYGKGNFTFVSDAQDKHIIFTVMVKGTNSQGEEKARHGTQVKKGVYEILDEIRAILTGQTCGLNIAELKPVFEGAVGGTGTTAVYGIDFKTMCRFEL